ncbi:hypothetical protein D3C84_1084040 [compost metagenome]
MAGALAAGALATAGLYEGLLAAALEAGFAAALTAGLAASLAAGFADGFTTTNGLSGFVSAAAEFAR